MKESITNTLRFLAGVVVCYLIILLYQIRLYHLDTDIKLDLPEEYSQATSTDTLIAIKKGDTLFVQFNNK